MSWRSEQVPPDGFGHTPVVSLAVPTVYVAACACAASAAGATSARTTIAKRKRRPAKLKARIGTDMPPPSLSASSRPPLPPCFGQITLAGVEGDRLVMDKVLDDNAVLEVTRQRPVAAVSDSPDRAADCRCAEA